MMQDEFKPRLVEALTGRITVPADAVVAAGQTASFCTIVGGQLFAWGKLKPSGARFGGEEMWVGGGQGLGRRLEGGLPLVCTTAPPTAPHPAPQPTNYPQPKPHTPAQATT